MNTSYINRACIAVAVVVAATALATKSVSANDDGGAVGTPQPSATQPVRHTADSIDTVMDRVREKNAILLDVREKPEWDAGHLRRAVLLPLSDLRKADKDEKVQEKLKKLSKDKILYCHCRSGGRVLAATPILRSLGYDIRPLKSGYEDLLLAGFEKAPAKKVGETEKPKDK